MRSLFGDILLRDYVAVFIQGGGHCSVWYEGILRSIG